MSTAPWHMLKMTKAHTKKNTEKNFQEASVHVCMKAKKFTLTNRHIFEIAS